MNLLSLRASPEQTDTPSPSPPAPRLESRAGTPASDQSQPPACYPDDVADARVCREQLAQAAEVQGIQHVDEQAARSAEQAVLLHLRAVLEHSARQRSSEESLSMAHLLAGAEQRESPLRALRLRCAERARVSLAGGGERLSSGVRVECCRSGEWRPPPPPLPPLEDADVGAAALDRTM